jgi:hypothetical protein
VPSSIRTFLPVVGDPAALTAAFERSPALWLPAGSVDDTGRHRFTVHAGAVHREVSASVGAPWRAGATRWRAIAWDPVTEEHLLPSLDGELGLHLEPAGRATLVFDARYQPPGGMLGAAADAVGLRRVARATVQRFVEEVAARLAAEAVMLEGSAGDPPEQQGASAGGA